MDIHKQLIDWAKSTVKDYNETGLSYYTQSPLNEIKEDRIDLLVLGINPGSWSVPSEGLTVDAFLRGNPFYKEMREGKARWAYWDKLYRLLEIAEMQSFANKKDFVLTNIFFGSTKKESGISWKDYKSLKEHTFELIDLLKPKIIICLGLNVMDVVLIHYLNKNDRSCQIAGLPIRYKVINNMKVFGFHHPAYYYSNEEKQLVGHFLKYYKENEIDESNPLPDILVPYEKAYINRKNKSSLNQSKGTFEYNKLIELLRENMPNLDDYRESEACYRIPIGKDKSLKLTVSSVRGTIAIRSANPKKNGVYVTAEMESLMPLLESLEWVRDSENPTIWLAKLDYGGKSEQEICSMIVNTISQMKDK